MANRRTFLTAVASGSAGLSFVAGAPALAQVTPAPLTPAIVPGPVPSPSASPKLPSFQAAALAERFKIEFDPELTDDQRSAIAFAIDANRKAALALNPKKKRLKNSDEPAVRFAINGGGS